jgi:hypothetical protein
VARVYISYNHADNDIGLQISQCLKEKGHQVTFDIDTLTPGMEWRTALSEGLKDSEVFVALITEKSLVSQHVLSEIGSARAFAQSSSRMLIIPVILDEIPIPPVIADINAIISPARDIQDICTKIEKAISVWIGRRAADEEKRGKVSERIEVNAAEYIDDAIKSLESLERRNRYNSNFWYAAGFISLLAGIGFVGYAVTTSSESVKLSWIDLSVVVLKSAVVIGLLGACAKYAFTLGKSYISEALKSSDRLHAISFGKFYLRVYGTDIGATELKDAFQHWNIDRESSFSKQNVGDIDPKIVDIIVEVAKSFASRKNEDKKS